MNCYSIRVITESLKLVFRIACLDADSVSINKKFISIGLKLELLKLSVALLVDATLNKILLNVLWSILLSTL